MELTKCVVPENFQSEPILKLMISMKPVLFVNHNNSYFAGLFQIAVLLIETKRYQPIFMFAGLYPTIGDDIQKLKTMGICFCLSPEIRLDSMSNSKGNRLQFESNNLNYLEFIKRSPLAPALRKIYQSVRRTLIYSTLILFRQQTFIRKLIRDLQITLVVLPSDNRYDQAVYVNAARKEGINSAVVPQFVVGPLEWAEYVQDQPDYWVKSFSSWLLSVIYPHWVYNHKGRKLIALPPNQAIARELLGIAPPLPWVLHSGSASAIALESDAVRDYGIAEGLPAAKLVITGSAAHDIMSCLLKNSTAEKLELSDELGFSLKSPLIVSALPPDVLYQNRPDCEFKTYDELLEFWCRSLALISHNNAIICLHPSVRYDDFKYVEKWGVRISKKSTLEMIPLCDIFVASISATIQWAIACGKPVLNYDVYRYGYYDYDCVKGVIKVNDKEQFLEKLKRLVNDSIFYDQITACQSSDSKRWGRLDGKAGNRLIRLFDELVNRRFGVQTNVG